jgi:hypothetical protein
MAESEPTYGVGRSLGNASPVVGQKHSHALKRSQHARSRPKRPQLPSTQPSTGRGWEAVDNGTASDTGGGVLAVADNDGAIAKAIRSRSGSNARSPIPAAGITALSSRGAGTCGDVGTKDRGVNAGSAA